jgi:F-type H+-transporting ATPase subunit epsilon
MKIRVISSSGEIFQSDNIKDVYAPAFEGEVGILPGHINYVSPLAIGEMRIRLGNGETKKIVLSGGIIQSKDDEVTVLADEASLSTELVKEEIAEAIKRAEEKLSGPLAPSELIQLEKLLRYERFKQQKT